MKKILASLSLLTFMSTSALTVSACSNNNGNENIDPNHKKIITAINNNQYQKDIDFKTSTEKLPEIITGDFIGTKLEPEIKAIFKPRSFHYIEMKIDGRKLVNDDLALKGEINAELYYDYGTFTQQQTHITLTVKVTDQQIVDAIKENLKNFKEDWRTIPKIITAEDFKEYSRNFANILAFAFLPDYLKPDYNFYLFKVNNVTTDNRDLNDTDFTNQGTIDIKFTFSYNTVKNENVVLQFTKKWAHNQ